MAKLFFILFFPILCFASHSPTDSIVAKKDSLIIRDSTLISDSLKTTKSDIDSIIYASSTDSLIFKVNQKKMEVFGSGELKYKDTYLKSGKIYADFVTNNVDAFGVFADSTKEKLVQTPILKDKAAEYKGRQMKYNFKTTKGYITFARTEEDKTSYSGAKIKKLDKTTFFVEKGVYSTCDELDPHYAFFCAEMKVIPEEQVIGKWIWLTFGGVPFPIPLPFAVFPLQTGRRSGIIPPVFGSRQGYGKYFSRFGYFWAINDYMDLTLTGDYYTRGGAGVNAGYRYSKRYNYTGNFEGSYAALHQGESTDATRAEETNWRVKWIHNQNITPSSRLDVNLEFMSAKFLNASTADLNQLLKNTIISNANYYQSWEEAGTSLSASYSRSQELKSGDIREVLPNLRFSKSQFYPFKAKKFNPDESWYEKIGVNYSGELQNTRTSLSGVEDVRGGVQHALSINASPKVGFVSLTPSLNMQELWYSKQIEKNYSYNSSTNSNYDLLTTDIDKIGAVHTFNLGVNASTKFYGIFPVNSLGIAAIRHTVVPSLSYNFTPDFSKDFWGYYNSLTDSTGKIYKYSRFEKEIYGGASRGESQSLNFSASNIFELKTIVDPSDTLSKEKKINLLNVSASIGYNFAADSLNFSDISLGYRTQIGDFSFTGNSNYSLYDFSEKGGRINQYLASVGKGLLRMTNVSFNISTTFSGDKVQSDIKKADSTSQTSKDNELFFRNGEGNYKGLYDTKDPDFTIPWSVNLSYNYRLSRDNPLSEITYSNVNAGLNFNISKNWKFSLSGSYDFSNKQFSAPQITINRDLHCWIMNFSWNPIGTYTGYRFEIRVKAPQLQDLKVEKSDNFFSGKR